jgi:hypothetical protein
MKKLIIINHGRLNKEEMSSCKGGITTSSLSLSGTANLSKRLCGDQVANFTPCMTLYGDCTPVFDNIKYCSTEEKLAIYCEGSFSGSFECGNSIQQYGPVCTVLKNN